MSEYTELIVMMGTILGAVNTLATTVTRLERAQRLCADRDAEDAETADTSTPEDDSPQVYRKELPPMDDVISDAASKAAWRIKPEKGNTGSFDHWEQKCLADNSIGIHYGLTLDFTEYTGQPRSELKKILDVDGVTKAGKQTFSYLDIFLNQIKDGDHAIICKSGHEARHVIRFVGPAYFDNSEQWKNGEHASGEPCGFYHRRKFDYIGELPPNTKLVKFSRPTLARINTHGLENFTQ